MNALTPWIAVLALFFAQASESERLWAGWNSRLETAHAISATLKSHVVLKERDESYLVHTVVCRPDKMRSSSFIDGDLRGEIISDGTTTWLYDVKAKIYQQFPSTRGQFPEALPLALMGFSPSVNSLGPYHALLGPARREAFGGVDALVVEVARDRPSLTRSWVYFDSKSKQVIGVRTKSQAGNAEASIKTVTLSDLSFEPKLEGKTFVFEPPKGVERATEYAHLLEGTRAPNFYGLTELGRNSSLDELLKGQKGLIVDFWSIGCTPCREEFPRFQELLHQLGANGLGFVGVNGIDSRPAVARFLKKSGYTFHSFVGKQATDATQTFKVQAFPATYVLDPKGKIVAVFFSYDDGMLRATLASLGIQ